MLLTFFIHVRLAHLGYITIIVVLLFNNNNLCFFCKDEHLRIHSYANICEWYLYALSVQAWMRGQKDCEGQQWVRLQFKFLLLTIFAEICPHPAQRLVPGKNNGR